MGDRAAVCAGGAAADPGDVDRAVSRVALGGAFELRSPDPLAQARARTLKAKVYQVMRRECIDGRRGSIIARDVYLLVADRALADIYQALKALRQAGLVRFVTGSRRKMEIAPGAPAYIADGRGRSITSLVNLKHFGGKRNTRASMAAARPVRGRAIVTE